MITQRRTQISTWGLTHQAASSSHSYGLNESWACFRLHHAQEIHRWHLQFSWLLLTLPSPSESSATVGCTLGNCWKYCSVALLHFRELPVLWVCVCVSAHAHTHMTTAWANNAQRDCGHSSPLFIGPHFFQEVLPECIHRLFMLTQWLRGMFHLPVSFLSHSASFF